MHQKICEKTELDTEWLNQIQCALRKLHLIKRLKKTDCTVLIGPARINDAGRNQDRKCDDADVAEKTSYGPPYLYCV